MSNAYIIEDFVGQFFPEHTPVVNTMVKCVQTANIANHPQKMEYFAQFCSVLTTIDPKTKDARDRILYAIKTLFVPYWRLSNPGCDETPLDAIKDFIDIEKVKSMCIQTVQHEASKIWTNHLYIHSGILLIEFSALVHLALQAKLSQDTLKKVEGKLKRIRDDYIKPALNLMYQDEEKHAELKVMNPTEIDKAKLLLKAASEFLQDNIDTLEHEEKSSLHASISGGIATFGAMVFGAVLFKGYWSLSSAQMMNASDTTRKAVESLSSQQGIMAGVQSVVTMGMFGVTGANLWNYSECKKLLNDAKEMKKKVDFERQKLKAWLSTPMLSRQM